MKIRKIDARGFRETGFVAVYEKVLTAEEEAEHKADLDRINAELEAGDVKKADAQTKAKRREKAIDLMLAKSGITKEELDTAMQEDVKR